MSTTIDERVVEMRFDNKDFEKNVQTSLKTIDDLKKHLNFDDSTKSVQNLQDSLRHFSIDDIGNALDDLNSKISAGGAMAFGVIQQIGASLVNNVLKVLEQIKGELKFYSQWHCSRRCVKCYAGNCNMGSTFWSKSRNG